MKNQILALLCVLGIVGFLTTSTSAAVSVERMRCENRIDPLGIDATVPHLSWAMASDQIGQRQTAYQILVASTRDTLDQNKGDLWDTGKVQSDDSIQIAYGGAPLTSGERCYWKVRVWDKDANPSEYAAAGVWSMGLLSPGDWKAQWIGKDVFAPEVASLSDSKWIWFPEGDPGVNSPAGTRYFRRKLDIPADQTLRDATCQITADNSFILYVNGKQAAQGNNVYATVAVDITGILHTGANVLAVSATNDGKSPSNKAPKPAGVIAAINVEFTDGPAIKLATDEQWRTSREGATRWEQLAFDDSKWTSARVVGPFGMTPWVGLNSADGPILPARMLRKEFVTGKPIARATAYVCGLGLFEMYLNGQKVGDHVLDPALTDYDKHVLYETFDVTSQLRQGSNAIGVILGNGRFFSPRPKSAVGYGQPKLLLQMDIQYADGSSDRIVSDPTWKLTTDGPIRANNEYDGEEFNAQMELNGWSESGFDDSAWGAAQFVAAPLGAVAAQMSEPIRVMETIQPAAITSPTPGTYIVDMGQNMVGFCRLHVTGPAGTVVRLRHAERLKADGTLYLDNMRTAKVMDTYVLNGHGAETYEPRFTYHGFRYVEVTGYPGTLTPADIEGRVVYDSLATTGSFECSNPLLNALYRNIYCGTRSNYRSIPTDCPQRDERQGWLGDRSAECLGESFMFDLSAFYPKWLNDIADAQRDSGSVPDVAPPYWVLYNDGVVWPSTYVIAPHMLLGQYGDRQTLAAHYDSMKRWTDYMAGFLKDGIMPKNTYGDWCVPPESPELIHSKDPNRQTPPELLSSCYFYYDLGLMQKAANLLGKTDDAAHFADIAAKMKSAFDTTYYRKDKGDYGNGSQTSTVLPLAMGLVPPEKKQRAFDSLVNKIVKDSNGHIGTGLVGGQWLMRVLSDNGRPDLAYEIATQQTYPSWGYMLSKDATTIWELWNGDTADPAMNSGNHVMLIGDLNIWLYEYLAGIRPDPDSAGYHHFILHPVPVGDLTSAKAHYDSIRGTISSEWHRDGAQFSYAVTIPANTTATVYVPGTDAKANGAAIEQAEGVKFLRMENGAAVCEVESGRYLFTASVAR